jgi:hypothetical protein
MKRLISWLRGIRLFNPKLKINNTTIVNKEETKEVK